MADNNPKIWQWFDGKYRVHCNNGAKKDEALSWKGSKIGSIYTFPDRDKAWDVTITANNLNKAKKLVRTKKV